MCLYFVIKAIPVSKRSADTSIVQSPLYYGLLCVSQGYQTSFNSYPYDKDTLPVVYGQLCVSFVN